MYSLDTDNQRLVTNLVTISELHDFKEHPFKVEQDMQLFELMRSIEEKGLEVSKMFDVVSDYRYIYVSKNYVFYRIEDKYIRIINLYHKKEDFML